MSKKNYYETTMPESVFGNVFKHSLSCLIYIIWWSLVEIFLLYFQFLTLVLNKCSSKWTTCPSSLGSVSKTILSSDHCLASYNDH